MIQNTDDKPLSELFGSDNKVSYHIPKYQREYIWSKWEWEALFDDIEESAGGHFLGSIICINTQTDTHKPADLELVDGQQRMTTISLFYLAIYQFLSENLHEKKNLSDEEILDYKLKFRNLRNRIYLDTTNGPRLIPAYSNHNYEDYLWAFSNIIKEIHNPNQRPKNLGNRRIYKAFNYFHDRLRWLDENKQDLYSYDDVLGLLEKLNSAILVKIDVASHADAFTLFETLNNRGVPLSAIDLIKNKLLGHLEKKDKKADLDRNFERWNAIITNLSGEYKVQERFLRQFYNAFKNEQQIAVGKSPKALRSNLIWIYEQLINRDVHYFFNRLEEASSIYSKNIQYEIEEHSDELIKVLRNLENVTAADAYMLLLFIEKKFNISASEKTKLIKLLCNYAIRRNVTDSPPTRDLTNHFMEIIVEANKLHTYSYEKLREIVLEKGKPASDEYFQEKLNGYLYEENVGATRYILSSIELAQTETKEIYTNFYAREKRKFVWTIEHVFPQGDNIPEHWVQMVADGSKELANDIKNNYVHKLGNLTLTGYNSQLSNMPLDKKQNRRSKDGKLIGFKNGLYLNAKLKDIPKWGKSEIEERTNLLVDKAMEIFKL